MSRRERHAEGMSKLSDAQLHIGRKPESEMERSGIELCTA